MGKVNFAIAIGSKARHDTICTVLRKNDVLYECPMSDGDQQLLPYIKRNAPGLGASDAIIIDLGDLRDTDEQIIEAVETIRFMDDGIRIIVISSPRDGKYRLLSKCFLDGIYNLILACSPIDVAGQLENCILKGMSYKDAIAFRDEEALKKASAGQETGYVAGQKTIIFMGTGPRMGVTHSVLAAAYTLMKRGYIVAAADCTGSRDYLKLMQSHGAKLNDNGYFNLHGIDFHIKPTSSELRQGGAYNYVLYDVGQYGHLPMLSQAEKETVSGADERVLLCGSKPWETEALDGTLQGLQSQDLQAKYLFNFTSAKMQAEIWKMMKLAGISNKSIYLMDYQPDPFMESARMGEILGIPAVGRHFFSGLGCMGRKNKSKPDQGTM